MSDPQSKLTTRPLTKQDFDQVVNIDASISGRRRPGFFEKRLAAALEEPKYFVYIGCEYQGKLKGFLLVRLQEGEYGGSEPVAVLDAFGVDPDSQGHGIGRAMLQGMEDILRHKNIKQVHTHADWRNQSILRFFANVGFRLSSTQILERDVNRISHSDADEDAEPEQAFGTESGELDYSGYQDREQFGMSAKPLTCRSLQQGDLESLIRIDHKITARDRRGFYERKVKEVLDESGIRVSLVAEQDGSVIGFIMARVDFGEFDRTEPRAVLDNLGVDPDFAHHQTGRALLAQLLRNLMALRIEMIDTEIDARHIDVLSFLVKNNFRPSQELTFAYTLY